LDKTRCSESLAKVIQENFHWPSPKQLLSQLDEVVVFGTGAAAASLTKILGEYDVKVACYLDNDKEKQNGYFHDKQVRAPAELKNSKHLVLIASAWAKDIASQLFELSCEYLDFSFCVDFSRWQSHFDCDVFDAKAALEFGERYLKGEDLMRFLGCIRYRQTYDPLQLFDSEYRHYINPNVLPLSSDVYIDAGAWQGDTLQELKDLCGNDIEIHSFEPDEGNFKIVANLIANQGIDNCFAINKALWKEETTLRFLNSTDAVHSMQSRVSDERSIDNKITEVLATTIDKYSEGLDRFPSYIKMDIEGAEPEALSGAEKLLRDVGPNLAISVYHEPNHIWELMEQIKKINPGYRFWFVHHSQHLLESVLYARVDG